MYDDRVSRSPRHDQEAPDPCRILLLELLDAVPSPVAVLDPGLRYRYANQAHMSWFGTVPPSGTSLSELTGPELAAEVRSHADGGRSPVDWFSSVSSSSSLARQVRGRLETRAGGDHLLVLLDQPRDGDLALRERTREVFLGMLGHDLRNPLTSISSAAQYLLLHGPLQNGHARAVARIGKSVDRMARLVDHLLDFTRSRLGGGIPIERGPMLLDVSVREIVDELELAFADHVIEITSEGDLQGSWDRDRLAQALSNVVGNALEHGAPSSKVEIALRGTEGSVEIRVRNQGEPISPELLPTLFEPFRKASDHGRTSRSLGLGLYITRQIVEAHGGRIDARSGAEGTEVIVVLPRA